MVTLRATVYPYLVRGEHSTRRMISSLPSTGVGWAGFVACRDGAVVGWAAAYRNPRSADGLGQISLLHVHPSHRRRGIGTALLGVVTGHLHAIGVEGVAATVTPDSLGFARRHGFQPTRDLRYAVLDLHGFNQSEMSSPGVRLVSLREVDEHALYAADVAAATDEPGDSPPQPAAYETWRYDIWEEPDLDRDASTVALSGSSGSEIVSFSLLTRDGARVWSDMTATVPSWRGRGLARLVKTVALRRAAEAGATTAYTANDESNLPMLAVNTRLGYRQVATQLACRATL
ncbi:GNAT family N-acetyltransferase [Actinoplanes sp. NPDC051861]|uniref:GNAT family N-acetyltransferase n=1 Tax=Actinoplanes sp. NPDC051861 TaxID=3155170 RepID=UPI00342092B7